MPSPDPTILQDLAVRLEAATGPDRELDLAIIAAVYGGGGVPVGHVPAYTASSDDIIELAERRLPAIKAFAPGSPSSSGWKLTFFRGMTPTHAPDACWQVNIRKHARDGADADAPTLPLAICLALVRALQQQEAAHGH